MKKYYCKKCDKYHYRGKIYQEHTYFRREITQNQVYNNNELKFNLDDLRPVAKRQFNRLLKKAKSSKNSDFYKNEIIKLIENEKRR